MAQPPIDTHEMERIARSVARFIAPYVAAELAIRSNDAPSHPIDYDDATCRVFVRELGDTVVIRAAKFFEALAERGELSSPEVKALLNLPNQRSIGSNLTVSLSKRIKTLGLSEPWAIGMTPNGERTIWRDRDGIAARMHAALLAEVARRGLDEGGR